MCNKDINKLYPNIHSYIDTDNVAKYNIIIGKRSNGKKHVLSQLEKDVKKIMNSQYGACCFDEANSKPKMTKEEIDKFIAYLDYYKSNIDNVPSDEKIDSAWKMCLASLKIDLRLEQRRLQK